MHRGCSSADSATRAHDSVVLSPRRRLSGAVSPQLRVIAPKGVRHPSFSNCCASVAPCPCSSAISLSWTSTFVCSARIACSLKRHHCPIFKTVFSIATMLVDGIYRKRGLGHAAASPLDLPAILNTSTRLRTTKNIKRRWVAECVVEPKLGARMTNKKRKEGKEQHK